MGPGFFRGVVRSEPFLLVRTLAIGSGVIPLPLIWCLPHLPVSRRLLFSLNLSGWFCVH